MPYRFARERPDYSDFASGRVFQSLPGRTAFPVRLADELFQRCLALRPPPVRAEPATLYDPCCGGATLLCTLALLHWSSLRRVIGSDADPEAVALAERNLVLLTPAGIAERRAAIERRYSEFGKSSHADALASAERFQALVDEQSQTSLLPTRAFAANALNADALLAQLGPASIDLVVTDLPYGQRSTWLGDEAGDQSAPLTWRLLDALRLILAPTAVVTIITDKSQRARHDAYTQVGRLQIGKRRATFLTLTP